MIPYNRRAWFRLLLSARGSFEHGVPSKVVMFGGLAVAVWAVDHYTSIPVRLPVGFHEIAGIVVGLILTFRTNTGYSRFWEGRTLWGGIVNASRNLSRIVCHHAGADAAECRAINVWIAAFAHATRCRLRAIREIADAKAFLPEDDYRDLIASPHPALYCAGELSRRVAGFVDRKTLDPMLAATAERQIAALVDYLGGCERILRTPTPLGYVLLMERTVALYLFTFPSGLLGRLGGITPIVTMVVAYLILMVETIGNDLDNPFGTDPTDIPLDDICDGITFDMLGVGDRPLFELPRGVGTVQL